ncbi:MAG: thiamine pyrophosphate-binding protein [Candidatus Hodarchaeales archaeon]|jgi:acetolactate synthase-1/2/3 large subunit
MTAGKERLTGGEMVAEYILQQEVPFTVGIPGHGCLGLVDAFKKYNIPIIQVRHEQSAAHLADGYFRVTGRPLVAFTSIGPGGCNTVIGVATAFVDSTAMIVITGSVHVRHRGHGVLQEIERAHWGDFASILKPIVKRSFQVSSLERLPWVLHNAFKTAVTGRPGPVHIDLPMDIQAEAKEVDHFTDPPFELNQFRAYPDPNLIEKSVELLINAKNPAILAGGGVLSSNAMMELKQIAEHLAIPVVCTMAGKGAFAEDNPLFGFFTGTKGSPTGNELTRRADVILALGCRFADETTSSYEPGVSFEIPPTKLIQVDIDPRELGKNYPVEVSILSDVKSALEQMIMEIKIRGQPKTEISSNAIANWLQTKREEWFAKIAEQHQGDPMTISHLLAELRKVAPRSAFIVTSAGHTQAALFQEFPIYTEKTHITSGGFSTMGFGIPAAIGVKLAHPDRTVISVEGDGSFLMTCQELATAQQLEIPIIVVIADNSGWISIRDLQIDAYGKDRVYGTEFLKKGTNEPYSPNFVALAQSFGCWAKKCTTPEEFQQVFEEALEWKDGPAIIWTPVARDHPRSESPVYGSWDVPKPEYLEEEPEYPEQEPEYSEQEPEYSEQEPEYPEQEPEYPEQEPEYPEQEPEYLE